jgi:hypothetical protein
VLVSINETPNVFTRLTFFICFQVKPAECFSAVEKLLMACCTMQPEDGALPRGDAEGDGEVYHKNDEESSITGNLVAGFGGMVIQWKLVYQINLVIR